MARARASGRRARARLRLALAIGAAAVVVVALVVATRGGGSGEPSREGSTLLAAHPPAPLDAGRRVTAYRVVYSLRERGQRAQVQEDAVLRPFDGRTATPGAGGREQVREASFGRLAVASGGEATVLAA